MLGFGPLGGTPLGSQQLPFASTGDQIDILGRLKRRLPPWFGNGPTPRLDALLTGPAWAFAQVYALWAYAKKQTRIASATGGWLDLIAADFFGSTLLRFANQSDTAFRARILASILGERATRAAVIKTVQVLTGRTPILREPSRVYDGCAYAPAIGSRTTGFGGYNSNLGYGSLTQPYAIFVDVLRPLPGATQFGVSDADIYAAINAVRAGGITAWVRITGP